jgi:hypothetical protein
VGRFRRAFRRGKNCHSAGVARRACGTSESRGWSVAAAGAHTRAGAQTHRQPPQQGVDGMSVRLIVLLAICARTHAELRSVGERVEVHAPQHDCEAQLAAGSATDCYSWTQDGGRRGSWRNRTGSSLEDLANDDGEIALPAGARWAILGDGRAALAPDLPPVRFVLNGSGTQLSIAHARASTSIKAAD